MKENSSLIKMEVSEEMIRKHRLVNDMSRAMIRAKIGNVQKASHVLFVNQEKGWTYEYVVVTYKGGAIAVRNNNCNSTGATLQAVANLAYGGYYAEVDYYKRMSENPEWQQVDFSDIDRADSEEVE